MFKVNIHKIIKFSTLLFGVLFMNNAQVISQTKESIVLYGYQISSNGVPSYGFKTFTSDHPEQIKSVTVNTEIPAGVDFLSAGEYVDGFLYGYMSNSGGGNQATFVKISTDTWDIVHSVATGSAYFPRDMAYDGEKMYGIRYSINDPYLFMMDMNNGQIMLEGSGTIKIDRAAFALASNLAGQLFVVDMAGDFCSLNKTTGTMTVIGPTGYKPTPQQDALQSMAFDLNTGRLFWAVDIITSRDRKLLEIDPATGRATEIGSFTNNAQVIGLHSFKADKEVAGKMSDVIVPKFGTTFTKNETITALVKNIGKQPLSGFVVKLKINGNEIGTKTFPGTILRGGIAEVSFPNIDLSALAPYEITASLELTNNENESDNMITKTIVHFSAEPVELYGYKVYENGAASYGFISFSSANPQVLNPVYEYTSPLPGLFISAGEHVDGTFYGYLANSGGGSGTSFVTISTNPWDIVNVQATGSTVFSRDMAYDYKEGIMYGIRYDLTGAALLTINMEDGKGTVPTYVAITPRPVFTLACNHAGELFAIDMDGNFCSLNKNTGALTIISSTGFKPLQDKLGLQSMAFDHNTGRLFWAMFSSQQEGRLIEIEPKTGIVFDRGKISQNAVIVGLYTVISDAIHTIAVSADPNEGGVVSGGGDFANGVPVTISAVANPNYEFVNWTKEGVEFDDRASFSFSVFENLTLVANFVLKKYEVILSANPEEGGSVSGGETGITHGTKVTATATPETGYKFVNWTKAGVEQSKEAVYEFSASENLTLVANFVLIGYEVILSADPEEGGSVTGGGTDIIHGTKVTATATPETGYDFVNWTKASVELTKDAVYEFFATEDVTLVANFILKKYDVVLTADPEEGGSVSGGGTGISHGTKVTATATPKSGYKFVNWTNGETELSKDAVYEFSATENLTLVAHFGLKTYEVILSVDPEESGSVTGDGFYTEGEKVIVTATPETGYDFVNWTNGGTEASTNDVYEFFATEDLTLVANFVPKKYDLFLSANPEEGGTVTGEGTGIPYGTKVTVTATPNPGYFFTGWTDDDDLKIVRKKAIYEFKLVKNTSLTANFSHEVWHVTLEVNPEDGGTVTGDGAYEDGFEVIAEATPETGYDFVNWTIDEVEVSTNPIYIFTATEDVTVVANFAIQKYNIVVSAEPIEGGTATGGGTGIAYGTSVNLTATAESGYKFINWTENEVEVSTNGTYIFTASKNRTLVANFELIKYTIAVSSFPIDGGTTSGGGIYLEDDEVKVIATAASGYKFVNWTENDEEVSTDETFIFTASEDRTLVANFELIQYTIVVSSEPIDGGTTSGGGIYLEDAEVKLIATAASGYKFVNWTENDEEVSTDETFIFTASEDRTLVANFELIEYTIAVSSEPIDGGTTSGGGIYLEDAEVKVIATPASGYKFVNWTENNAEVSTDATYIFTASKDRTLVANFELIKYTIAVSSDPIDGGTTSGGGLYSEDVEVTVTATAATDYKFVNWTENGDEVSTDNIYKFTASEDRTLVANFELTKFKIVVKAYPIDGGTITGGGLYSEDEEVTVIASAVSDYIFVNWTEDGVEVSTDATYIFTASGHRTLIANFELTQYTIIVLSSPTIGGTVTGGGFYSKDEEVTVTATAATDYKFVNWTVNGVEVSTDDTYIFEASGNRTLVANFAMTKYTIAVSSSPIDGGTVTGGGIYSEDDEVTVIATPATDYKFINWTENGDEVSTNDTYKFTASGNRTLVANFASESSFRIIVMAAPTIGGTVAGGGNYQEGETIMVTATANAGYKFVNWTNNGTEVSTSASYSFEVIEDITLVANFAPYSISVNPPTIKLAVGEESQLEAVIQPDDIDDKTVTWSSDKTGTVEVNAATGMVKAISVGTATITAKLQSGGFTANCLVTVYQPVTGITVDPESLQLKVGEKETLTATIDPADAENQKYVWSSNNSAIADVDAITGEVTAIAEGEAIITATTEDGNFEASCTVTVMKKTGVEIIEKQVVNLYPNPTNGRLTLSFEIAGIYDVTVTTISGTILQHLTISDQIYQMDISSYPEGVYLMLINDGMQQSTIRIVKVN